MIHQRSLSKRASARLLRWSAVGSERLDRRHGLIGQLPGTAAAAVDAQKPGVRPFAELGILADALAQFGLIALDVEQVVDDLERQTNGFAIPIECLEDSESGASAITAPMRNGARSSAPVLRRWIASSAVKVRGGSTVSCAPPVRCALRPEGRPSGRPPCPSGPRTRPGSERTAERPSRA